jgi:hypothetical protein
MILRLKRPTNHRLQIPLIELVLRQRDHCGHVGELDSMIVTFQHFAAVGAVTTKRETHFVNSIHLLAVIVETVPVVYDVVGKLEAFILCTIAFI